MSAVVSSVCVIVKDPKTSLPSPIFDLVRKQEFLKAQMVINTPSMSSTILWVENMVVMIFQGANNVTKHHCVGVSSSYRMFSDSTFLLIFSPQVTCDECPSVVAKEKKFCENVLGAKRCWTLILHNGKMKYWVGMGFIISTQQQPILPSSLKWFGKSAKWHSNDYKMLKRSRSLITFWCNIINFRKFKRYVFYDIYKILFCN